MGLLVFYLLLALGASFLCSLLEAALLSVSPGHVNALAEKGHTGARLMQRYKASPDRPLAAILSANTVAHTVGAAGVGAEVAVLWGDEWLGLASGLLTIAILLLTEIVPKSLGTLHAKRLVGFTARTVEVLIVVLWPLVIAAQAVGKAVSRGRAASPVSRDEVVAVADLGLAGGSLDSGEARTIRNLLALRQVRVCDVMTPRTVVEYVPADMTVRQFNESERDHRFARMPVVEDGNIDRVQGVIHRVRILDAVREGELDTPFGQLARPALAVPEIASAAEALETALRRQEHLLLAVDEFGGTAGIVTMEDLLETLLGVEIVDETDPTVDMREHARRMQKQRLNLRTRARSGTGSTRSGRPENTDDGGPG